jgi:DNA-binding Xre family transcriptional regulator
MGISYKKLSKLLIDRDMKKKTLMAISGVSQSSVTKMGKNENVNTAIEEHNA